MSLSDKIGMPTEAIDHGNPLYLDVEDVKLFIKELRKELIDKLDLESTYPKDLELVMSMIDKLAGDKLV